MSEKHSVNDCFNQPPENHGHPGSISRVIIGPGARRPDRPSALNSERLVIHTNDANPEACRAMGMPIQIRSKHFTYWKDRWKSKLVMRPIN